MDTLDIYYIPQKDDQIWSVVSENQVLVSTLEVEENTIINGISLTSLIDLTLDFPNSTTIGSQLSKTSVKPINLGSPEFWLEQLKQLGYQPQCSKMFEGECTMNRDDLTRDIIIFGDYDLNKYSGGVRNFEDLTVDKLKQLLDQGFIKPTERQNCSPDTASILEFMEKYPSYLAHGYTVTIKRSDYRVTLTGVSKDGSSDSEQETNDFISLFSDADEFHIGNIMFCWFD